MSDEILPGLRHFSDSPSAKWLRDRASYREQNQKRVQATLSGYKIPIYDMVDGQKVIVGYRSTPFKVNDERHAMLDIEDIRFRNEFLLSGLSSDAEAIAENTMAKQASDTLLHCLMTVPDDLPHEDVDGPPIMDLDNEEEILNAIDLMKAKAEKEDEHDCH